MQHHIRHICIKIPKMEKVRSWKISGSSSTLWVNASKRAPQPVWTKITCCWRHRLPGQSWAALQMEVDTTVEQLMCTGAYIAIGTLHGTQLRHLWQNWTVRLFGQEDSGPNSLCSLTVKVRPSGNIVAGSKKARRHEGIWHISAWRTARLMTTYQRLRKAGRVPTET
jgi:hypothetical protein